MKECKRSRDGEFNHTEAEICDQHVECTTLGSGAEDIYCDPIDGRIRSVGCCRNQNGMMALASRPPYPGLTCTVLLNGLGTVIDLRTIMAALIFPLVISAQLTAGDSTAVTRNQEVVTLTEDDSLRSPRRMSMRILSPAASAGWARHGR